MRSSRLALVGGLLLLLAGLSFVFQQDPEPQHGGSPKDGSAKSAPEAADTESAGHASGDSAGMGRMEASGSAAVDPNDWTQAPGPRMRLRVIEMFTRAPVPEAVVWVFDPDHYDRVGLRAALETSHHDWEPQAQRFARRVVADKNGELFLPQPLDWYRVICRSNSLYGELYHAQGPDGQTATLYLEPDLNLRVRTVNLAGEPVVGLEVGLREESSDWSYWRDRRTTDAEGRAVFAHLQETIEGDRGMERLVLAPAAPFKDGPRIEIRLGDLPESEQVLTIPAYGSLRVRLYDADHRPFQGRAAVMLQGAWGDAQPQWEDEEAGFVDLATLGNCQVESADGEAFFPYVGIGEELQVAADFDGTENWETITCHGPDAADVTATADLVQRVLRPSFRVRLLDADGQPLRDTAVGIQDRFVTSNWMSLSREEARTDAEGHVQRAIGEDWLESQPNTRRWIEFVSAEGDDSSATPPLGARIEGRASWRPGVNDLGDVRLEALPLLATGRVVNGAGEAIARADVALAQRYLRSRGRESWRTDGGERTATDRDGNFLLHGFPRDGDFRVEARHWDYPMAFVAWVAGSEEHLIKLSSGQFVSGQILRDPEATYLPLEASLMAPGAEPGAARVHVQAQVERNGHFRLGPGAPELGDLWLQEVGTGRLLWRVRGLPAQDLGDAPDPRLDPLDLRGKLRLVRVICSTPEGTPIEDSLQYALTGSPSEAPDDWHEAGSGSFSFLAGEEPLHLWIRGLEYKEESLSVSGRELRVTLRAGPQLRLQLQDPSLMALGQRLYAELSLMREADELESWWIQFHSEVLERRLAVPGEYSVRLYVAMVDAEGDWDWHQYPREDGLRFQLQDVVGSQTVRLPWTAAEVLADIEARLAED